MFTGIVEEIGSLQKLSKGRNSAILTISAQKILDDISLGDSIAVNGVCLTVTSFSKNSFCADAMHETLNRSSLGHLKTGSRVNLERAMPANGRFGGHIVSGHIDGTGTITAVRRDDNALWYTIEAPPEILRFVIEKGSVAIDGISLTVAATENHSFSVSVIPHTAACTILSGKRPGDIVNLENDCIGKYVIHFLTTRSQQEVISPLQPIPGQMSKQQNDIPLNPALSQVCGHQQKKTEITLDFLARSGF